MWFNAIFGGAFIIGLIIVSILEKRAERRESWFDESNDDYEIKNVYIPKVDK